MQSGGWGRDRARHSGEDRLVVLAVGVDHLSLTDIGRKRHPADAIQQGIRLLGRLGSRRPYSVRLGGYKHDPNVFVPLGIERGHGLAGKKPSARLAHQTPQPLARGLQEQPFPVATRTGAETDQARRHDARVVQHQAIPSDKDLGQIANVPVGERLRGAIDDQQPGIGPVGNGKLGDQCPRQFVVVLVDLRHARQTSFTRGSQPSISRPSIPRQGIS